MVGGSDFWAHWQPETGFRGLPKVYERATVLRPTKFQKADPSLGARLASKLLH